MARISAVKSPSPRRKSARINNNITGYDSEDDSDQEAADLSMLYSVHRNKMKGQVELPISDFSSVRGGDDEGGDEDEADGEGEEDAEQQEEEEDAEQQEEEELEAQAGSPQKKINDYVDMLQAQTSRRVSTGKLRKVNSGKLLQPQGKPVLRPTAPLRKLGPQMRARPDAYELGDSPPRIRRPHPFVDAPQFSPRRRDRQTHAQLEQERVDAQLLAESQAVHAPQLRKSPRKRQRDEEDDVAQSPTTRKKARAASDGNDPVTSASRKMQDALDSQTLYASHFRDQLPKNDQAGADELEKGDDTDLARQGVSKKLKGGTRSLELGAEDDTSNPEASSKRKPGRSHRSRPETEPTSANSAKRRHERLRKIAPSQPSENEAFDHPLHDGQDDPEEHDEPLAQPQITSKPKSKQNSVRSQVLLNGIMGMSNETAATGDAIGPARLEKSKQGRGVEREKLRMSELGYGGPDSDRNSGQNEDGEDGESSGLQVVERRARLKRLEELRSNRDKRQQKREAAASSSLLEEQAPDPDTQPDATDTYRVHGQFDRLRTIYRERAIQERIVREELTIGDVDVKRIVDRCVLAMNKYKVLKEEGVGGGDLVDPAHDIIHIADRVEGLYTPRPNKKPDFENGDRCTDIYAFLFPALIKLLQVMINSYETMDTKDHANRHISYGHLRTIINFIGVILDLYGTQKGGAKQYKHRPSGQPPVVKPVEQNMCVPLRIVNDALQRALNRGLADEASRREAKRQHQLRAQVRERQAVEARAKAEHNKIRKKWTYLHLERREAEPVYMTVGKQFHLKQPALGQEQDSNGEPFERLEVFTPRIGPPPDMIAAAREVVWRLDEINALQDGLRTYAGELVLEKIFRRYCGRFPQQGGEVGLLNRYNVTEIVTAAADLKEYLVSEQRKDGGEVEEWVRMIPVWTKSVPLQGQENDEEEVEDEDEERGEEGAHISDEEADAEDEVDDDELLDEDVAEA